MGRGGSGDVSPCSTGAVNDADAHRCGAAVPHDLLVGTEVEASFDQDDDSAFKVGNIGGKRYVRVTITPSGNNGAALPSAVAVLGKPQVAPTP